MICPKCGSSNNDNAKFCSKCGTPLFGEEPKKSFFQQNKILIICIAIVAIVAASVGTYAFVMSNNVPLQTQSFDGFSMSVPVGSNFVENFNTINLPGGFVSFENKGEYYKDVFYVEVSSNSFSIPPDSFKLDGKDGDLTIYKSTDGNNGYIVERQVGSYRFGVMGFNLDVLKKMASSIQVTGTISDSSSTTVAPTSTPSTPSAPSSSGPLKIISGSFSTGSDLEDKTYAEIYVGANHAGEKVIVQIFYSRDGSSLNNGNYVPVTVDSSGYISVASAEAYDLYPDYATIKLYDANYNLKDTLSVSLSPTSGTQTF